MSRIACVVALLLATACPAEKPKKEQPPPKVSSRPIQEAPPPQLDPLPVEPTPPPPEPTLVPAPNTSTWWCLCYRRNGVDGPESVTACRELEEQCRKLEQRVAKGSDDIIAGSLMQSCRSIAGSHPSDVAGTPEQWKPSALPGAWVSEGACLLVEAAAADGETGFLDDPEPTPPEEENWFALMHSELIGDIAFFQSAAEIRSRLGEPQSKGPIEEYEATGGFEQAWKYPDGLTLLMRSDTRSGPQEVRGVIIVAPSTLPTRRGIKIGNDRAAVERAYGDVQDKEVDRGPDNFTAGSIYGGLHFEFERGVVTRIFLGAAAE